MEESRPGRHYGHRDSVDNGGDSLKRMRCLSCWAVSPQNVVISGEQESTHSRVLVHTCTLIHSPQRTALAAIRNLDSLEW